MPKIKIKDWNGIVTNIDETDTDPAIIRDSSNFRFKKGYTTFEPRLLTDNAGTNFAPPDLSINFTQNFVWETGIYCTLTNDPLKNNEDEEAWKKDICVLVAKAQDGDDYHRLVYLKELEDTSSWKELSKNSGYSNITHKIELPNHDGAGNFDGSGAPPEYYPSYFTTQLDGKAFFQIEKGTLKLYLPHDVFIIRYIFRVPTFPPDPSAPFYIGWNIDRLVEKYDPAGATVKVKQSDGTWADQEDVPDGTAVEDVRCGENRRLGIKYKISFEDDESVALDEFEMNFFETPSSAVCYKWVDHYPTQRKFYLYKFNDAETSAIIYPKPPWGKPNSEAWWRESDDEPMDDSYWAIYQLGDGTANLVFSPSTAAILEPQGTTWSGAGGTYGDWNVRACNPLYNGILRGTWKISKAAFEAQTWLYKGKELTIGEAGFLVDTDLRYSIVCTAVLDDGAEVIMETSNGEANLPSPGTRFAIRLSDIYIPTNINKRLTRIRWYHKTPDIDTDYTLHREVDLLTGTEPLTAPFYMGEYTDTGKTLSTNIGFLIDEEDFTKYDVLTGFKSFTTESGISIGITTSDNVNLYHSTVGGGQLLPDLVYDANALPITGISDLNAVANINGKIGAFTPDKLYVIGSGESLGQLVFNIDDTLDLGVKNFNDVVPVQGGAVVNTRNGIFWTDGFRSDLISEPINDLVRTNYDTSSIYYNSHKMEVYWKPTSSEDLYRYRFEDKVWEKINKTITEVQAEEEAEVAD